MSKASNLCVVLSTFIMLVLLGPSAVICQEESGEMQNFPDCDTSVYYASLPAGGPTTWSRKNLAGLVTASHRQSVSVDGLWQALTNLDERNGRVHLVYSNEDMAATPYGSVDSWTRENLWPAQRGASGQEAFSDVHNIRPEATRVTFQRKNMFYGKCGTVEFADVCEIPAAAGLPSDTMTDRKVWLPPENARGEIARALMYMDLRYRDSDLNLTLTDCPPFVGNMAYLSQLVEWDAQYPPSPEEIARNQKACQFWQGNRNPFVDFPLGQQIFGPPQVLEVGARTYPSCMNIPTMSPTASPNECTFLQQGDIFLYVIDSDTPDGVGFMALENITAGLELYMTDNAWTGSNFLSNEGVLKYVVPEGGIEAGKTFGYGPFYGKNTVWTVEEGQFDIGTSGDSIFLYCILGDGERKPLMGFTNTGSWAEPGLNASAYGSGKSALPDTLIEKGSIALPHFDNYRFNNKGPADKKQLQADMQNPENWQGSDEPFSGAFHRGTIAASTATALVFVGAVGAYMF